MAASENIVSNILIIKKTKIIFSFSQKHSVKNRKFLSENLKTKAKLKNKPGAISKIFRKKA